MLQFVWMFCEMYDFEADEMRAWPPSKSGTAVSILVLGHSRLIWARLVLHQDMQTVLRCHMAAFEAIGGVPTEILYDRMKTAVIGQAGGSIVYNRALIDFVRHYGFQPKACRPYRAKTKGKVERPFRYCQAASCGHQRPQPSLARRHGVRLRQSYSRVAKAAASRLPIRSALKTRI